MTSPKISIVVLNWNGAEDTLACLASLANQDYPNFDVSVVDNGSTDGSLEKLNAFSAPYAFKVIATGENLGYAGGNNVGIQHALERSADFVLVLNNDTTVAADLLSQFVAAAERNPDAGIFCARVMYYDRPQVVSFDGGKWNPQRLALEWPGDGEREEDLTKADHDSDYACGASLFFRSGVARKIGLLDEKFFLVWEEVDWCFRAREAGWRIVVVPKAKVWHKVAVAFNGETSPLRIYFSTRNKLLWVKRHGSTAVYLRVLLASLPRLIPTFYIAGSIEAVFLKRMLWGLRDYFRSLAGYGSRYEFLSGRRAVLDYLTGRFGDCPNEVRTWSKNWAAIVQKQ